MGMAGGLGTSAVVGGEVRSANATGSPITILETNDPVDAGDNLEVTATYDPDTGLTRQDLELLVAGEPLSTRSVSTGPSEDSVTFNHRTYPVQQDVEFEVAVQADSYSVEQTVEVRGISELDETHTRPAPDLAVQSETTVMFEVEDRYPDEDCEIHWFVDGEYMFRGAPIWESHYRAEEGADYWLETFETEGTHSIAAAVVSDDHPNQATQWDVSVTDDGAGLPIIDATQPTSGTLEAGEDVTHQLALDVSAPTGQLDRVIWWMHQADTIHGISSVSGETDTATLETTGGCYTCDIEVWVLTERNLLTRDIPWTIDDPRSDDQDEDTAPADGEHTISIVETTAPVDAGAFLEVTAAVENTGAEMATIDVDLVVGDEIVDSGSVTIGPDESETTTLGYETYPVEQDVEFPVRVETAESADEQVVTVHGTSD